MLMPNILFSGLGLHRILIQFKKSIKAATKTFLLSHRYYKSYLILIQVLSKRSLQDFFKFAGNNFLVVGSRFSGWTEIFSTPSGTSQADLHGLIKFLLDLFSRFGVPEEISSDGEPGLSSS